MAKIKPPTVADIVGDFLYYLAGAPAIPPLVKKGGTVKPDSRYAKFATDWMNFNKTQRGDYIDNWLKKNKYAGSPEAAAARDLLLSSDYVEIRRVTSNPSVASWIAIWIARP